MLSKLEFDSAPHKQNRLFRTTLYALRHIVKRSAIIETLLFLSAILLLNIFIGDGNRFTNVSPHPFWIIVLLITLKYGVAEAIVAAILASIFLIAGNLPEQSLTETMYSYILRVLSLPFLWVVTALILGGIRTSQLNEMNVLNKKLKKSNHVVKTITDGYNAVKSSKEQLELRLASEKCSIFTVYEIAKSLETHDPLEIPAAISHLVKAALNPAKFSIFLFKDNILRMDMAHGWKKLDAYDTQFAANSALANNILNKKHPILSVVNEADESILMGQGVMAGPIFNKSTGKVFGMLKIEEIKFSDVSIKTQETFQLVCEWIAYIYTNAEKHHLSSSISLPSIGTVDFKTASNPANLGNINNENHKTQTRRKAYAK